jgi:penicillin amidase
MRWLGVFSALGVALGLLAACDDGTSGPFDGLPLDGVFTGAVQEPVHVARDTHGVAHIVANNLADAGFVQGYVMAHDRLPQMDVLRRFGAGTLAELFGTLDPATIDADLEMRMHRMAPLAQETWAALQASSDPDDQAIVQLLQRFADGVNAYAHDLQQGSWTLDPALATSFDPARFAAWSPVDSLVIERLDAFSRSFSAPFELDATELYDKLRTTYDDAPLTSPAAAARHGISRDLLRFKPVGTEPTIPGFPDVASNTGARSGSSRPAAPAPSRPAVPQEVFDTARAFFAPELRDGPLGALGPHAFRHALAGSNTWAVGAELTDGVRVMLASDQQGPLSNPMMFYPTHLQVSGDLDVLGLTLPGIPGVLLGTNGHVAWAAGVGEHDVNDVYLEQIAPCGGAAGGDCVPWIDPDGGAHSVAIQRFTEEIKLGTLGTITGSQLATYEIVPHHGPIIPVIDRTHHALAPRTSPAALSISYTGYQPTFEIRARYRLAHARSVDEGVRALADALFGSADVTLIDTQQHIGWTTAAYLPVRRPAAYAWDPLTHQDGLAPFFVLPGTGDGDWLAAHPLPPQLVPHAIDPPAGYLVSANADPVGATFDGLPLNQGVVTGEPLYAGITYDAGLRAERITRLVQPFASAGAGAGAGMTLDDMAAIQRDTRSSVGEKLTPAIVAALAQLEAPGATPPDLAPYVAALPAADRARLVTARGLLGTWTFATPPAPGAPGDDSAATALFHAWMHCFIARALADELDAVQFDVWRLDEDQLVRIVHAMLTDPRSFVTSPSTQQPILCDSLAAAGPDDSCTKVILQAMVDAMTYLESPQGFGSADPRAWRWGALHRLALRPLFPEPGLTLPALTDATPTGFPRAGDSFTVNRGDRGWQDLDFSRLAVGPTQRFLAAATRDARGREAIVTRWTLPGGVIFDSRSPHYRDLLDGGYLDDQPFDAPYAIDDIVAAGESRWVFR